MQVLQVFTHNSNNNLAMSGSHGDQVHSSDLTDVPHDRHARKTDHAHYTKSHNVGGPLEAHEESVEA